MPPSDPPAIPEAALSERFLAATGPGGQNVNKVETAVQLHVDIAALDLPPDVERRLRGLAGNRINSEGELVLVERTHRSREANRVAVREKLAALIERARHVPRKRAKTRLNRVGKVKRLAAKKNRGTVKKNRGKVEFD